MVIGGRGACVARNVYLCTFAPAFPNGYAFSTLVPVSLARARCAACTLPLGDAPHTGVGAQCVQCGAGAVVAVGADGQPADFNAGFNAARLLAWMAAARIAMARGHLGVAVGGCPRCQAPLVLPSLAPLALPCPHCQDPVKGAAGDVLGDLWPEPWTRVASVELDLEYRLEVVDGTAEMTPGCAACGFPTPPNDPAMRCRRCNAVTWMERNAPPGTDQPPEQPLEQPAMGRRMQLGVRVNGTRAGVPFKVLVPILQGEMMLRADAQRSGAAESGRSVLSVTGLGCVAIVAIVVLLAVIIVAAVHFARR